MKVTKIKCDKCRNEVSDYAHFRVTMNFGPTPSSIPYPYIRDYDICYDCLRKMPKFSDFLESNTYEAYHGRLFKEK